MSSTLEFMKVCRVAVDADKIERDTHACRIAKSHQKEKKR